MMKPDRSTIICPYTTVKISTKRHSLANYFIYDFSFFKGANSSAVPSNLDLMRSKEEAAALTQTSF